jgi:glycosyltransferase involved in cell wall biosynthesis
MKILVASHTYIVDLNCEKFRLLSRLGDDVEVTIVVPQRWQPGGVQNKTIVTKPWRDNSFRVVPVSNFSQNHQGLLCFGLDLIKLLRDFQPDVIQVEQGSRSLAYAELITCNRLFNLGAKCTFFTWWNLPYQLKFPITVLEAYNLRHTDGLVAGNQDAVDILAERGYHGKAHVAPQLGVDETLFRPQAQPELRAKLGLDPDDFVIGFVGRFVPEKGIKTLAQALLHLKQYSWKWLLLGRGPLKPELQQWAEQAGVSDRLVWVESVPHDTVPNYINQLL